MKKQSPSLLALSAFAATFAAPAGALEASRSWVSNTGSDANITCAITSPCRSFIGAHLNTSPGGEINCLNTGEYGPVTITKSITIKCLGATGGIIATSGAAITINAGASDTIVLDGLDIDGVGTGAYGVSVSSASKVTVVRTSIRNFAAYGIAMASGAAGGHMFVNDSFIIGNAIGAGAAGSANILSLTNTSLLSNTVAAVQANVSGAVIGVQNSVLNDSPIGILRVPGALVISVGPGNLVTGSGSFTNVAPYQ
jgi:hypothetical protein